MLLPPPPPHRHHRLLASILNSGRLSYGGFLLLFLCRLNFTRHSITYLFRTTYTPADALTIAALVAYMNAALPPDKHEEFDTAEVTRAAKTLHDRGNVAFQGDTLKLLYWLKRLFSDTVSFLHFYYHLSNTSVVQIFLVSDLSFPTFLSFVYYIRNISHCMVALSCS
jgi:hypothetical protein